MSSHEDTVGVHVTKLPITEVSARLQSGEPEIRQLFASAHAILSEDAKTGEQGLFYGKELLEDIANGRASEFTEVKQILCVVLDDRPQSGELEWLYAAVLTLKGSCCYE